MTQPTWTNRLTHPLAVGTFIKAEVQPCYTCAKIRSWVPGMAPLKPLTYEGTIVHVVPRGGMFWYQLQNGKMIQHTHVKLARQQ